MYSYVNPRPENTYSGAMSIYFPCKLKSGSPISWLNERFSRWQQHQVNVIHSTSAPLTDLMDKQQYRDINETFLNAFQKAIAKGSGINKRCSPFGTECLRCAYRKNREDNLYAKNAQLLLSRFSFKYTVKGKNRDLDCDGVLLFNVNADNSVATFIVVLNFKNYTAVDLIYLKHFFYKRLLVCIDEYDIVTKDCNSPIGGYNYFECKWFDCLSKGTNHSLGKMTIQDFVNEKRKKLLLQSQIEYDIDYRARYSFIELNNPICNLETEREKHFQMHPYEQDINARHLSELYGIMMSDEGYKYYPIYKLFDFFKQNNSTRTNYDLYVCGLNAMIVTSCLPDRRICKQKHAEFECGYDEPDDNVKTEPIRGMCIPGVIEEFFPSFLKAVEVHYLINKITTNEIAIHERSFLYPWIFLKRLWLLWEIIYDVDSHKYHINPTFQEGFGIRNELENLRKEYNSLLNHTLSYCMAVVTIIAAIFAFIQIWK